MVSLWSSAHARPRFTEPSFSTRLHSPLHVVIYLLLAACGTMLFRVRYSVPCQSSGVVTSGNSSSPASLVMEYDPSRYSSGVLYRSGNPTSEGYGTFFQQYKSAIVMAMYLGKTLIIQDDRRSAHGYVVGPQVNVVHARPGVPSNYSSRVCEHKHDWDWGGGLFEKDMLQLMCLQLSDKSFKDPVDMLNIVGTDSNRTRAASAALAAWKAEFEGCPEIHAHGSYGREEAFNDCVQPWLSYTLRGMFSNQGFKSNLADNSCLNVGIHIRWGDLARADHKIEGSRNMDVHQITHALGKIKQVTSQCYNFYIFAKNATRELVEQLETKHRLVDGDDDLYDMFLYSLMDVYVQGVSSWAVMPTFVHAGRVLITGSPNHPKLHTMFREVNSVYHFSDPKYMQHIARLRPLSAVRAGTRPTRGEVPRQS